MQYFVNLTSSGAVLHQTDTCFKAKDRHGPFATMQEAIMTARILGIHGSASGLHLVRGVRLCQLCFKGSRETILACACQECFPT